MATPARPSPALACATDAAAGAPDPSPQHAPTLRVRNLPSALSSDAVTSLLSHYGAARVRVLRRKKAGAAFSQVSQVAIAEFATKQRLLDAQQRLTRVQLAGHKLAVEILQSDERDGDAAQENGQDKSESQPPLVGAMKAQPPLPALKLQQPKAQVLPVNAPAPLAPHLGLNFAPSPLLLYKYPKATVPIVRNIANALIALPRFYTQVLHLMNKMNLPTPFEPGAIPGVFSEDFMLERRHQQRSQRPAETAVVNVLQQIVEEEGEDDEAEADTELKAASGQQPSAKRPRPTCQTAAPGKKRPRKSSHAHVPTIFQAKPSEHDDAFQPPRAGVISLAELDRQRVPDADRARDPMFAKYAAGAPSRRVRVGNVAPSVDAKDLEYVFGHVLPLETPLESLRIEVHSDAASARLIFPSEEVAQQAVQLLNGVVLDGQPLLVCFHEDEPMSQPTSTPLVETAVVAGAAPNDASAFIDLERMALTELAQEKAVKNYQRGEPTHALYLKNLAKAVDESAIRRLCRRSLPASIPPESLSIRHFTEGRMKNQAFVEFPSADAAATVLEDIHGLVLHGKPLVVSFRKSQAPQPQPPPST